MLPEGWLLAGLREVAVIAKRRPELVRRVHDQPSGYLSSECDADCALCEKLASSPRGGS